jgi:hypothetical protein
MGVEGKRRNYTMLKYSCIYNYIYKYTYHVVLGILRAVPLPDWGRPVHNWV